MKTLAAPQTEAPSTEPLKWPVAAACAVVVVAVGGVAAVRASGVPISVPDAPVLTSRLLTFADRSDGGIDVVDARSHRLVETVTGESGFVRGTLRGMARERRRAGVGAAEPFDLVAHVDGRLTLVDATTKRRVDLESFGPTNTAEFARMLGPEQTPKE